MNVSVIIPARNAAQTITETLESLRAQTYPNWEAIVVDDGSSDETATLVTDLAKQDARTRMVSGPHRGVSAARNTGISLARFDWLLFLDADDWLLPIYLERMMGLLQANPNLDAVHCDWARVTPEGKLFSETNTLPSGDLFDRFAYTCVFAIHACVVRRSLVETVGGFDVSLRTCEDWDLWQRIARTGAQFGAIHEMLALYRMRAGSASIDGCQMLADGVRVLAIGHSADPRVPNPAPAHADGLPAHYLPGRKLGLACWCAGLMLGSGQDARPLFDLIKDDHDPNLDLYAVAYCIFEAALLPTCRDPSAWVELWAEIGPQINNFLTALEGQAQARGLAHRARLLLERLILEHSTAARPLTIGTTYATRLEITAPISDILPPAATERLQCAVELEGTYLGLLELPICDGLVAGYVLADAIAAEFTWPILSRFFEQTIYPDLRLERGPAGLSIWRGSLCLADGLAEDEGTLWAQIYDQAAWTLFLQELWARSDWPNSRFYDPQAAEAAPCRRYADQGWLVIEVSEELPDVELCAEELRVVLTVGGTALGVVTVPVEGPMVTAQKLRVALTLTAGLDLCHAAVREGLLGQPLAEPAGLRARLATLAAGRRGGNGLAIETAPGLALTVGGTAVGVMTVPALAPGSVHLFNQALPSGQRGLVLSRRGQSTFDTSASRRAMLPTAAVEELIEAAAVAGEPVIDLSRLPGRPAWVVYVPEMIWRPFGQARLFAGSASNGPVRDQANLVEPAGKTNFGRSHFETLFAARSDPWQCTHPYEQTKYAQTLELLPPGRIKRALELACAEGHFTLQLAPHVDSLLAADISQIALERAAKRCAGLANVRFMRLDLTRDPLPGQFGLIVCSEALYYTGDLAQLQAVARTLAEALEPGGYLLTAHTNLVVDEPDRTGFDWDHPFGAKVIGETLASTDSLQLVKELRLPLYRVQLFRREPHQRWTFLRRTPQVIKLSQPAPPSPRIAGQIRWHGGRPEHKSTSQVVTDQLPILMYHRVAPDGSPAMARWRVTPAAFEEQLAYLRDAGFYSVSLEEWRTAMALKKPLPGRAILITFDDGYRDFLTYAWPLLKRYGFSAIVFLVAAEIGRSNSWDRVYGEEVPLLGWPEIRQLQQAGVEFGSHSASHPPLTALPVAEVACEAARSRAILERGLGRPVKAFAYPYGDTDRVVQHLIGACGYVYGLSCQPGRSRFRDSLLALPRIEVTGLDSLPEFVLKVGL